MQIVAETDARLRVEGPLIWEVDPATRIDAEQRVQWNSREDWWWWLDQVGESERRRAGQGKRDPVRDASLNPQGGAGLNLQAS
jgi:hypothetical protein